MTLGNSEQNSSRPHINRKLYGKIVAHAQAVSSRPTCGGLVKEAKRIAENVGDKDISTLFELSLSSKN